MSCQISFWDQAFSHVFQGNLKIVWLAPASPFFNSLNFSGQKEGYFFAHSNGSNLSTKIINVANFCFFKVLSFLYFYAFYIITTVFFLFSTLLFLLSNINVFIDVFVYCTVSLTIMWPIFLGHVAKCFCESCFWTTRSKTCSKVTSL